MAPSSVSVVPIRDKVCRPFLTEVMVFSPETGYKFKGATLKSQGVPAEEATQWAKDVFAEIRPATHFMIDDASIYAIKPLLLVDAAGLVDQGGSATQTWLAAGAGIQVTVVTAKFEAGYMRTVSGPTFGDRGNVFVRLVFQNLF